MKSLYSNLKFMFVAFFALFGMTALADEVTWTASEQGYENTEVVTAFDLNETIKATVDKGSGSTAPAYYNLGTALRLYGYNTLTLYGATITKVELTMGSGNATQLVADNGEYVLEGNVGTWTGEAESVTFTRDFKSGHNRIESITVTYQPAYVDPEAPEAPVITPEAGTYYGSTDVTITAEEGTEIYYTLNGGDETLYVAPFTLTETTKVEAYAKKGEHVSSKVTASYTIGKLITSLEDANMAAASYTGQVRLVADNLLVAYVNGQNTYVTDGTSGLLIYGNVGLTAGNVVKGNIDGTLKSFNGLPEIATNAAGIDVEVVSEDNEVAPAVIAAADLKAEPLRFVSRYVTLKGAQFAESQEVSTKVNVPFTVGELEFVLRNNFLVEFSVDAEKEYNVSGFVTIYNDAIQLYPIKTEDVAEKVPLALSELVNASFDEDVSFGLEATDNYAATGSAQVKDIAGWTSNGGAGWCVGGSFAYGTAAQLNGVAIPAEGPSQAALGISVGWSGTVSYSQPVSLPVGYYAMSYKALNIFSGATQMLSRAAVVGGGKTFSSEKTSFTYNVWETDFITFDLDEEIEEGRIQIGGTAISGGSGANAKVLFDDVELKLFDTAEERDAYVAAAKAQADLEKAIAEATALKENTVTGTELFMKPAEAAEELAKAIDRAQQVADNADATAEEKQAAIEALATAVAAFNAVPVVKPEADAKYTFRLSLEVEPAYYLSLDKEANQANVSQSEELISKFTFVETETEGQYLLKTDDEAYLGFPGSNVWSMNATEQTAWAFTRLANGTYTIDKVTNANHHVGAETNVESNSQVWADKGANRAESQWFIEKVNTLLIDPALSIKPEAEVEEGTELTVTFTAAELGDLDPATLKVKYSVSGDYAGILEDNEDQGDYIYLEDVEAALGEAAVVPVELKAGFYYNIAITNAQLLDAEGNVIGKQNPEVSASTSFVVVAKEEPVDPAQDVIDVMAKYPQDVTALVPDMTAWEGGLVSNSSQHWDGTSSSVYYEQTGAQWGQTGWENSSSTEITLPAGKYVLLVPGRSSADVEAYLTVGEERVVFPNKGDVGFGIATDGTPTFAEDATYANNGNGRGWEYRYIEFESDGTTPVSITLGGSTESAHQWMSFTAPILRTTADNTAVAKEVLKNTIDEANDVVDSAAEGPFQKGDDAKGALEEAIETAQAVYDNADATIEEVNAANDALREAIEAYNAAEETVDETKYYKVRLAYNADPAYYLTLDAEYQYVYVSQEDATPVHFVQTDVPGQYFLVSEDGLYVGMPGTDNWTMRTSYATPWAFTRLASGAYTIDRVDNNGHVGTENDVALNNEGLPLTWGDKGANRLESQWFFELVQPEVETILVDGVEVPVVKTVTVNHEEDEKVAYSGNTETFDVDAIVEALGVASISDAKAYYISVPTSEAVEAQYGAGTFDGWRTADGTPANWGAEAGMVCVKIQDPASGVIDYIGCIDNTWQAGQTFTAKFGFVANDKAAVVEVVINFVGTPELYFNDLAPKGFDMIDISSDGGVYEEERSSDALDIDYVKNIVGSDYVVYSVADLNDGNFLLTKNYTCDPHPGFWFDGQGVVTTWGTEGFKVGVSLMSDNHFAVWSNGQITEDIPVYFIFVNEEAKTRYVVLITVKGVADGISNINTIDFQNADVYTLGGVKLQKGVKPQKGIYVVGGKKVVVK